MEFDFKLLKLKIKEVYDSQENFAEAMGLGYTVLNQRLNNRLQWKPEDIVRACQLLHIPLAEAHLYFFIQKV